MMLRGEYDGHVVDNTTSAEVEALAEAYRRIRPREVMLYSIDRQTPARQLTKVSREDLDEFAARFRADDITVQVN